MTVEVSPSASGEQQPLSTEQAKIANNHGIYSALVARGLLAGDMSSTNGYGNYWGILADAPVDHGMAGDTEVPLSPIVEALHEGVAIGILTIKPVDTSKAFNFRLSEPLQRDVLRKVMNVTEVIEDVSTTEPLAYRVNVVDGKHYPVLVGADFITFPEDANAPQQGV